MNPFRCMAAVIGLTASCAGSQAKDPSQNPDVTAIAADEPSAHLPKVVQLSEKVIADAHVKTNVVSSETLAPTIELPGEISADPDKSARVSSPVAGRIEEVAFKEGSAVKRGEVLAILRVPELGKARATYAATSAKGAAARANANRLQDLVAKGLAANQDALAASADADALQAEARAAEEQLRAMGLPAGSVGSQLALRAPLDGVIVRRNALVGQPVSMDETIALIADLTDVWFMARVFEQDLEHISVGARAEIQLNAYKNERFAGVVEYISKEVDPMARTLAARIRLTNRDDLLRVGLFGTARIDTRDSAQGAASLVVPLDALTDIDDRPVVFVAQGDGKFERRAVRVGSRSIGKVQILAGLREGERVVVDGVFTVKSAVLKATFAEEE